MYVHALHGTWGLFFLLDALFGSRTVSTIDVRELRASSCSLVLDLGSPSEGLFRCLDVYS